MDRDKALIGDDERLAYAYVRKMVGHMLTADLDEARRAWNDLMLRTGHDERDVYDMAAFDANCRDWGLDFHDVAEAVHGGGFCPEDAYWWWSEDDDTLRSADHLSDTPIDAELLAQYAVDNDCDFHSDAMRRVLDRCK